MNWLSAAVMVCSGLAALSLTGCASNGVQEANRLTASGQPEEALKALEAAARAEPRQAAIYNTYIAQRNALTAAYTRDADALRAQGRHDAAEAQYRNALRLDPGLAAAQSGLNALQRERRLEQMAIDAAAALQRGDTAAADRQARAVLQEDSGNRTARAVVKAVVDHQARSNLAEQRLTGAMARKVSLELRDAPLKQVFDILAREGGLNFILDKEVRTDARATIVVRETNLDEVIRLLLLTNQLDRRVLNDNSLLIYPATQNKQREYQELVMRSFYLANADAKQTAAMIRAMVKTRDIFTDEKLNLVIMRDTPEAVRLAEQLVASHDLPESEVMLEVEVLEIASSLARDLGVTWPTQISVGPSAASLNPDLPSSLYQLGTGGLRAFVANPVLLLNLRQNDGTSNLLANPRIRVKNRDKAKVHIGERVPVITTTSTANVGVSSSVTYLETGLKLDVEPNVYLEDEVGIKVQLEVSNILEQLNVSGTVAYRLGTRSAATSLRLRDGETQVLAGLINNEDRRSIARVPGVGEVPVFGRLFRNDTDQLVKSEIVLLITPRIIRNVVRPDTVATQYPSGTEIAPGAAPVRLASSTAITMASRGPTEAPRPVAAGAAPGAGAAGALPPAPAGQSYPLVVAAPTQATVGDEFTMTFTLSADRPVNSRVELSFDPSLLAVTQGASASAAAAPAIAAAAAVQPAAPTAITGTPAGTTRPAPATAATPIPAPAPGPGSALLDVNSPGLPGVTPAPVQVRFKVLAAAPAIATVGILVTSDDAIVTSPQSHTVNIVARQ